ncbi:uncharacterized protein LOC121633731 isoform X2 [Melanotaenia boesemani]|uniref:uncharacterized protein LOC121633731 isoform X2 n=1 Tax=Melanotaenia boesemani TaxID=1250792 RepID=UPI001C048AA8|nr:uncharacterized protein LOC121633731 isoform X2 [Melanotaenia boesemani]
MPMSWMLRHLFLAWTCLYVCGAPVLLPNFNRTQDSSVTTPGSTHNTDIESVPPDKEHVIGFLVNVGAGGGTGPHGGPEGTDSVTHTENEDSLDGRYGLNESGGEAWSQRSKVKKTESTSEMRDPENEDISVDYEPLSPTGGKEQLDVDMSTSKWTAERLLASTTSPLQLDASYNQNSRPSEMDRTKSQIFYSIQDEIQEKSLQSSTEPPNPYTSLWTQKLTSDSAIPPFMFLTSRTSTPLTIWGHNVATKSSLTDPVLPEIGPNSMPRDDGLESLWTEATKPAEDTAVPLSQDEATDATMSSEALPLIFEPFEDVTVDGAAAAHVPGSPQPPGAMVTRGLSLSEVDLDQLVTVETDSDGPSRDPSVLLPDWTSPWQTSGAELLEPVIASGPSVSQRQAETQKDVVRTSSFRENMPSTGPSLSSLQYAMTTVTMATHQLPHKSRFGLEEMESEEEADEDEDDENSEESLEEESEEDLTGAPKTCSTQPTYSLIPPPPVWVQRNQGLMRSWVELIREKAGYVSGMLAPVGIGITGALLIVGALYSIRMLHRKRRNSFKHQRRKVRQPEQPREPGTSRQDQAMLLADSSEDEF